ncbi:glucan biosynthesis protein [Algisphaera agarilytica]|uniref:Glucans biosynthesis protein G n=1 Tax=Algisphaera agarilytica TaxID=1385975 RepID=A0A7X0LLU5_9BACT|nr:glucan biosynthesis protein G [Algisphaera agarilytica]MBB6430338.1 glucans biosynthesis protein [Algisphaera agarilytica]
MKEWFSGYDRVGVASALVAGACLLQAVTPVHADAPDLAFEVLVDRARTLSTEPYSNEAAPLPEAIAALDYDGHRDIRCLPENFLWYGGPEPFRVQFRHRGWLFKEDVRLSTVEGDGSQVQPLPFSAERFTYGKIASETVDPESLPGDMGYAGLALHKVEFEKFELDALEVGSDIDTDEAVATMLEGAIEKDGQLVKETFNEFMSIQGGCYFRAIGFGQHWGSSARGIAINTGLPEPEEFPRWAELWVKQPAPGDTSLTLYGLLNGPSVTGAYRFVITPDTTTSMDITSHVFFRQSVRKLGIAPITGMFLFGEESPARFGDYRPEVHDADGLLMQHANGELNWRPLRNPHHTRVSRFAMTNPKGFGLIQRDRDFNHYEDLETEMQIRPSIWVEPKGEWGQGWVELLEIASDDEGIDNIGAYWVPANETELAAGDELTLSYKLEFTQEVRPADGQAMPWVDTRAMLGDGGDEEANAKSLVRTAVSEDAAGKAVARFILDTAPQTALPSGTIVRSDVGVSNGKLAGEPVIQYNKFDHAYRLFFDVIADGTAPVELRATLRGATALDRKKEQAPEGTYDDVVDPDTGPPLSETWLYRWDPQP